VVEFSIVIVVDSSQPPRPVSAVTPKSTSNVDSKPPRASSATVRSSTIPRAKTQIVRPQAAAHIITHSTFNMDPSINNQKPMVVNANFMEKVPAMARANQTTMTVAPVTTYISSTSYLKPEPPQQPKMNYAVSSIIMPKSESAPFLCPNGQSKQIVPNHGQGPIPSGSAYGPSAAHRDTKYDGAVFDDNGIRIDRTPTDDEINFLWDKLRTCLHSNSQTNTDRVNSQHMHANPDVSHVGPRQAAPVANTYIDGASLGQFNSLNRVAQPAYNTTNPSLRRQNSLDSVNSNSSANTYTRRYGLLQQRKQQPNPNSLKSRQQSGHQQQGYTVYQPPVPSQTEPQQAGYVQNGADGRFYSRINV